MDDEGDCELDISSPSLPPAGDGSSGIIDFERVRRDCSADSSSTSLVSSIDVSDALKASEVNRGFRVVLLLDELGVIVCSNDEDDDDDVVGSLVP